MATMGIFGFLGAWIWLRWIEHGIGSVHLSKFEGSWPHNGDIWLSGCLDLGQIGSIRMGMVFEREASLKGRQCLSAAGGRERWQTNQAGEETAASFCIILKFGSWELGHDRLSPTTSKIEDAQIVQCYEKHLTGLRFLGKITFTGHRDML